jgi:hypothetical protein
MPFVMPKDDADRRAIHLELSRLPRGQGRRPAAVFG